MLLVEGNYVYINYTVCACIYVCTACYIYVDMYIAYAVVILGSTTFATYTYLSNLQKRFYFSPLNMCYEKLIQANNTKSYTVVLPALK